MSVPSSFPLTREQLQAHADAGKSLRWVAELLGVSLGMTARAAKRLKVTFHGKRGAFKGRTPEGEAKRVAGVKAMWADPARKAAWMAAAGAGRARARMARSMADPDYVYTPHSEERVAKMRASQLRRLGTPEGHHQVYGVHVPDQYAKQAMDAGRKVYMRLGRAAAERFVAELLKSLSEN